MGILKSQLTVLTSTIETFHKNTSTKYIAWSHSVITFPTARKVHIYPWWPPNPQRLFILNGPPQTDSGQAPCTCHQGSCSELLRVALKARRAGDELTLHLLASRGHSSSTGRFHIGQGWSHWGGCAWRVGGAGGGGQTPPGWRLAPPPSGRTGLQVCTPSVPTVFCLHSLFLTPLAVI